MLTMVTLSRRQTVVEEIYPAGLLQQRTVHFGPADLLSRRLSCICGGDNKGATKGAERRSLRGKKQWIMTKFARDSTRTLRKAPQPPLSHPGAAPDSDRARKPALTDPSVTDQELDPGDRVQGLGNFGKPTGEFGTVERTNQDDAVVKWDDDGRKRLHQPWLKKV